MLCILLVDLNELQDLSRTTVLFTLCVHLHHAVSYAHVDQLADSAALSESNLFS